MCVIGQLVEALEERSEAACGGLAVLRRVRNILSVVCRKWNTFGRVETFSAQRRSVVTPEAAAACAATQPPSDGLLFSAVHFLHSGFCRSGVCNIPN